MSYILEALKKSQAERQLGELPTIHAPIQRGGAGGSGASRLPLWLALGATGLLGLTVALLMWRQSAPVPQPAAGNAGALAPSAPPVTASVTASVTAPVTAPVLSAPPAAPRAPLPLPVPAPAPVPLPAPKPSVAAAAPVAVAPPVAAASRPPAALPVPAAPAPLVAAAPPVPATPPAAPEESVAGLRDLPEAIQRQIPPLALGGYIYSKNPADRLLLIDKVLRHEGEEVAPGLTLEKLLPKAAVFNYKGYRYRQNY